MTSKTFNPLDNAIAPPAKAGTPNLGVAPHEVPPSGHAAEIQQSRRFGVPPSGGRARAHLMTLKPFGALEKADVAPAKAGTPNQPASLGKLEAEIQQGMKELEGMLK